MEKKEILAIIAAVLAVFGLIAMISASRSADKEEDAESLPAVYQPADEPEKMPETDIWDVLHAKQEQSETEPVVTDQNGSIVTESGAETQPVQPETMILEDGVIVEKKPNDSVQTAPTTQTTPVPAQTEQPYGGELVIVDED